MTNESGPKSGANGVVEDIKGKAMEAAGAIAADDRLKSEGRAQQDKVAPQREVAAKEVLAEKARAKASGHEAEQRAHQR